MNKTIERPRIGAVHRRALGETDTDLVRWTFLPETGKYPMVCEPTTTGVDFPAWAATHREEIHRRLIEGDGAILFRGFSIPRVQVFNDCVDAVSGGAIEYKFRASPRTQIQQNLNVFTSTDYPAEESIFAHNEHSYSPVFPLHLFLYCDVPPLTEGETPIGSNRHVKSRIWPEVLEKFSRKKIMYVRNFGDGFGLPWQVVFQTSSRADIEAYCRSTGVQVEWKSGDRLRTRQVGHALLHHPVTGEVVWFNHGTFFHELTLPARVKEELRSSFGSEDLPQNTFYGDGTPIEPEFIEHLQHLYREVMVKFSWQRGDVLMLDNMLSLHARSPYTGSRRVLVAMAKPCRGEDLRIEG